MIFPWINNVVASYAGGRRPVMGDRKPLLISLFGSKAETGFHILNNGLTPPPRLKKETRFKAFLLSSSITAHTVLFPQKQSYGLYIGPIFLNSHYYFRWLTYPFYNHGATIS